MRPIISQRLVGVQTYKLANFHITYAMEYILSPSENKLCKQCKELFNRTQSVCLEKGGEANYFKEIHHKDGHSFCAAVDSGCQICSVLLMHHLRWHGSRGPEFNTSAMFQLHPKATAFIIITVQHQTKHWYPNARFAQV